MYRWGGGSTDLGDIPKKYQFFFWWLPLTGTEFINEENNIIGRDLISSFIGSMVEVSKKQFKGAWI